MITGDHKVILCYRLYDRLYIIKYAGWGQVKMITGDHKVVAVETARVLGMNTLIQATHHIILYYIILYYIIYSIKLLYGVLGMNTLIQAIHPIILYYIIS